jgi:sulfur carrier protein
MIVHVNGKEHRLVEPLTLEELIKELGLREAACASELNRKLVPKKKRPEYTLKDGDVVEIVTMVGGG